MSGNQNDVDHVIDDLVHATNLVWNQVPVAMGSEELDSLSVNTQAFETTCGGTVVRVDCFRMPGEDGEDWMLTLVNSKGVPVGAWTQTEYPAIRQLGEVAAAAVRDAALNDVRKTLRQPRERT